MVRSFAAVAAFAALSAAPVQALQTYTWEFTADELSYYLGPPLVLAEGKVVRGTIVLPDGPLGTADAASFDFMIEVTETPGGPGDPTLGGGWTYLGSLSGPNAFEVSGGVVIDADAFFGRGVPLSGTIQRLYLGTDPGGSSVFPQLGATVDDVTQAFYESPTQPARFSAAPDAPSVPAPLPAALLATGLGALALGRLRRAG